MRKIVKSSVFKKDYKRILKRQYPEAKFIEILTLLLTDQPLPVKCKPHKLLGEYDGMWECHITPDWLLVYEINNDTELKLRRTGTHADLFK